MEVVDTYIFTKKNLNLAIRVEIPEKSVGLAFVLHGHGGFKEQPQVQAMIDTFRDKNYTTVSFDFTNACGASEGALKDATQATYLEDFAEVIAWSQKQDWFQAPFTLAGHSMGAFTAADFAAKHGEHVSGLFLYGSVVSGELLKSTFPARELKVWQSEGWGREPSRWQPGFTKAIPWSFLEEYQQHDLLPLADKLIMPVCQVVGEYDQGCPVEHQRLLFEALPAGQKQLEIVKGAKHTFTEEKHLQQLRDILGKWVGTFG